MIAAFFPLKKLRRNGKHLLLGAILLLGAVAVYHEMVAAKAWSSEMGVDPDSNSRGAPFDRRGRSQSKDSAGWTSGLTPQLWKPEFKGRVNLHVFEDWCGSSVDALRRNLHFPLYPHIRTTVSKLAVSPQWTNYGLRIFGYLHPYADGEFVFALGSDDNSELWLSTDESPLNLQLLAWVGKSDSQWTAPGEFDKYASQISRPWRLFAQRRYFFEVLHKQNDRGIDHVEVAWQLLNKDFRLKIIEPKHISLYTDESALLISDVAHIPQTAASHQQTATEQRSAEAEMLREDPRDEFHQVPIIDNQFLEAVLPDCSYKPTYTIKDFPLSRYQGLQFLLEKGTKFCLLRSHWSRIHLSYVYPNDFTRLTHMETERSCFYPENHYDMNMFDFSRYLRLDNLSTEESDRMRSFDSQREKLVLSPEEGENFDDEPNRGEKDLNWGQVNNAIIPDYGDDYDDYAQKRRRKLFALDIQEPADTQRKSSDKKARVKEAEDITGGHQEKLAKHHSQQKQAANTQHGQDEKPEQKKLLQNTTKSTKKLKLNPPGQTPPTLRFDNVRLSAELSEPLRSRRIQIQTFHKINNTQMRRRNTSQLQAAEIVPPKESIVNKKGFIAKKSSLHSVKIKTFTASKKVFDLPLERQHQKNTDKEILRYKEIELNVPLQKDVKNTIHSTKMNSRGKINSKWPDRKAEGGRVVEEDEVYSIAEKRRVEGEKDPAWGQGWDFEGTDYEALTQVEFDPVVTWNQTFQVNNFNLQALRSDWIDLNCNVSGNLLLHSSDALPIVHSFMKQLNRKHYGRFTLLRVINVVKRMDGSYGSRYLLELELRDSNGQVLRVSRYVYVLIRQSPKHRRRFVIQRSNPQMLLCNPVGFRWNPTATVHFIVPVKNQARWVQQLIVDMETLFHKTGDMNFNLIITDFNSTDMDVRKTLEKSSLPRYQYVKLSGNFERSGGLQAGINLIDDDHSIVFLCDLHIKFPPSIIDTIRKHCVEGYMAFAPVVLRLNCGVTPSEARGYWEVNGFGLLGIYKSDLVASGGMNTREFTDRWGGEDWELLDRILQAGLEIDRIFLRNFFHHYHSRRGMWNRRMSENHN